MLDRRVSSRQIAVREQASGSRARRLRARLRGSLPASVSRTSKRASERVSEARLSLHHSARNTRAGVVPPVVLVGIGQLAGCNGAIRSAVPFRCFASRTSLPRLHRPDLLELCIEISSSPTISISFTRYKFKSHYNREVLSIVRISITWWIRCKKTIDVDERVLVLISSYRVGNSKAEKE